MHGKGTVAIISYPALQSVVARVDGFKKGLSDTPDIKIVAEQPGITRAEALTTAQNIMQANANLNGLFGFGDDAALAAVIAAKTTFFFRKGDRIDPTDLRAELVARGYEHVSQVVAPGEFASRGGLLDLFPMGAAKPYRLDFFDDELDEIRVFDPDNQQIRRKS